MTIQIVVLLVVLAAMAVLFFTELLPIEITAFLGLVFLVLGGYVEPAEAFTGFASPAVITMLSIFFLSGALLHTGVADMVGGRVHRLIGNREIPLVVSIMLVAGVLSAFMNNVAAVAVLLPAVASIARKTKIAPSRLFMPLSFGAILGGTMTLVGTPPNILASDLLREHGMEPFGLFDFTPVGAVLLGVGIVYMITVGRWLLPVRGLSEPDSPADELARVYHLRESMFSITVRDGSPLQGKTLKESRFGRDLGAQVVGIIREDKRRLAPGPETVLMAGDELLVEGGQTKIREILQMQGLEVGSRAPDALDEAPGYIRYVEVLVVPESPLEGQSLRDLQFHRRFGVIVVGIRRQGELVVEDLAGEPLREGDGLLVLGTRSQFDAVSWPEGVGTRELDPSQLPDLGRHLFFLRVHAASPLVGTRIRDSQMGELLGLTVAAIHREDTAHWDLGSDQRIRSGDRLLVVGDPQRVRTLLTLGDVQLTQDITRAGLESDDVGIVEVSLAPRSRADGATLAELSFRERFGVQVLALWKRGEPVRQDIANKKLRIGDAFVVQGSWTQIQLLGSHPDFIVLSSSAQEPRRTRKAPVAIGALALMILMVATGYMPIHVAAFTAATLVVLLGAIRMEEVYRAVEWRAIFLVAAILPMGIALERTGAALMAADAVTTATGRFGLHGVLAGMVTMASALSQSLDGAPAVVMMTPVVLETAGKLNLNPHALMMAISLAASAAFMTPFSHKANLLVMGSGGYRTWDYLKVGTPLTVVLLAIMVLMVPLLFPAAM